MVFPERGELIVVSMTICLLLFGSSALGGSNEGGSSTSDSDKTYRVVYRAIAEIRADELEVDGNHLGLSSGLEYSVSCSPCDSSKLWVGTLESPDGLNSEIPSETGFFKITFKFDVEVYVVSCTDGDNNIVEECWEVSGTAAELHVYYDSDWNGCPPPRSCTDSVARANQEYQ